MMVLLAILLFGAFSIASFIYGGILAPSLRVHLRYRLFELRDQLRMLVHAKDGTVSYDQFMLLHSNMNFAVSAVRFLDVGTLLQAELVLKRDEGLRKRTDKRSAELDKCKSAEFVRIRKEANRVLGYALIVNSGLWLVWLVPVLLVIVLSNKAARLACVPGKEMGRVTPSPSYSPA